MSSGKLANGLSTIPPATLADAPRTFSISEQELIKKAKHVFDDTQVGIKDDSVLAENFRFEFPVVSLDKKVSSLHTPQRPWLNVSGAIFVCVAVNAQRRTCKV